MQNELKQEIIKICQKLFDISVEPTLTRPAEQFGDFATNIAMQLAGKLNKSPQEIAEAITLELANKNIHALVAGKGFINITLPDESIYKAFVPVIPDKGGMLLLEYSCPNAFKELHVGHLYQTILGDALGRVHARLGTSVYRVTFGCDVGLHVAKSIWAMTKELGGEKPESLESIPAQEHSSWLAKVYIAGTAAYDSDEQAKQEIDTLNKRIYEIHNIGDTDSPLAQIYWQTRSWSYDYFRQFYEDIGVLPFDQYIGESETFKSGSAIVNDNVGSIFEESDNAIILSKEKSGLHTRVFITSKGLPTYEAKDLGVIQMEANKVPYNHRIIMIGNEQAEYMKVVFKALELINPGLAAKQQCLPNGMVKFGDGSKMSSRLGNVTRAVDVVKTVQASIEADNNELAHQIALGAVKYTFLKNSIGGDIAFDLEQSVSTEGNSGPYLQYALVRARSILKNIEDTSHEIEVKDLDIHERRLSSWLSRYSEVLESTVAISSLHELCAYLYELAQVFNRFYENCRVIDDPRSNIRVPLVKSYESVLSDGLEVLGIPKPEKM